MLGATSAPGSWQQIRPMRHIEAAVAQTRRLLCSQDRRGSHSAGKLQAPSPWQSGQHPCQQKKSMHQVQPTPPTLLRLP